MLSAMFLLSHIKITFLCRGYCAPEFTARGEVSFKFDIYSLGVIITELVTGRRSRNPSIQNVRIIYLTILQREDRCTNFTFYVLHFLDEYFIYHIKSSWLAGKITTHMLIQKKISEHKTFSYLSSASLS